MTETGLYYYGARYLDPRASRWLSTDPAMGEYIPVAPVNEEARKHNGNLPGMGGTFNTVNLHVYHYAGNNPLKYTDPDGMADWDMTGRGIVNILKGVGKAAGGVLLYTASGAGTVASAGTGTPLAVLGFIGAGILVSNGGFQATVGIAEVLAGLTTPEPIPDEVKNSVPKTLTEVVAITADSVVSSATGEPSTVMQNTAEVVDTLQELAIPTPGGKAGAVVEKFISNPGRLDEYTPPPLFE